MRVLVLSLPSIVACGKNTALSRNEGILEGDVVGVLRCGGGGEGGGEPEAPVSFCMAAASVVILVSVGILMYLLLFVLV